MFLLLGLSCYMYPGLQQDEALFARPLFAHVPGYFDWFNGRIPVMLMSYLGCLKTWLYAPLLRAFTPSLELIRIPAILLTAFTVGLTVRLADLIGGRVTALCAGALLATDATYILTSTFDWGPVVLQHLLFALTALFLIRFAITRRTTLLASGAFAAGLATWDKALNVWILSACAMALLAVFPKEIFRLLSAKRMGIAVVAFLIGSAPLVFYNWKAPAGQGTFAGKGREPLSGFPHKALILARTFDGSSLFGYLVNDEWVRPERPPRTMLEKASVQLRIWAGNQRRNGFGVLFLVALAVSPFVLRGRFLRPGLALLLAGVICWLEMAFTKDAGGSAHHAVLLWPLPQLFVGLAMAATCVRFRHAGLVVSVVVGMAVLMNLANFNQYLSQFIRFGSPGPWNDSVNRLAQRASTYPNAPLAVYDWGLSNPVLVLNAGRVRVLEVAPVPNSLPAVAVSPVPGAGVIWAAWTEGHEMMPGANSRALEAARSAGLSKIVIDTVRDRYGRDMIEIFRYKK